MIEDDIDVGQRPGKVGELGYLGVETPGFVNQSALAEFGDAGAMTFAHHAVFRSSAMLADGRVGVPRCRTPDTAKAAGAEDLPRPGRPENRHRHGTGT